jgi:RNA polymerase sigma-32 factor
VAELVARHQGLVYMVAKQFAAACPLEDLMQEGNLGLLRAAEKFQPERGLAFGTYARHWVYAMVSRFAGRRGMVRRTAHGKYIATPTVSLDAPLHDDGDSTMLDTLMAPERGADEQLEHHQLRLQVRGVVARLALSSMERAIVEQRLMGGATLDVVAQQFGCSRERVRQVEQRLTGRLQLHLEPLREEALRG